jgi:hypothetical protein
VRTEPSLLPIEALRELARRTALHLVAQELQALAGGGTTTITVAAEPRLQLPPAPAMRRGRKPGPKPKRKAGWTPERRAKFMRTVTAKRGADDAPKRKPGRPRKIVEDADARCVACDHTKDAHVGADGRCLSARCVCREFCD